MMSSNGLGATLTVVIIDDDPNHLDLIRRAVEDLTLPGSAYINVMTFDDAGEAVAGMPVSDSIVVLCDHRLAGTTGLDWLEDLIRTDVGPVIMMSSDNSPEVAVEAFRGGASDFLDKSAIFAHPERISVSIREALRRFKLGHTNQDLARRLKIANRELERNNEKLAQLTETAHRFVDDVAHEFRTPLTVIQEFSSIMSDGIGGPITPEQRSYLAFINHATRDLAHLVDDFLDSSKLRARTLRVDRCAHDPAEIIDGAWKLLEVRAQSRDIQLKRSIPPSLPAVFADAEKAQRTLINLVVNAIKVCQNGSTVRVQARQEGDGVTFAVVDDGPGLAPDEVTSLFERFRQGNDAYWSNAKGFGLGLSIVRELTAVNLGTISIESKPGKGSTFAFNLPIDSPQAITQWALDRFAERQEQGAIAVLRVHREQPFDPQELRSFIASACHSNDVQLPGADGESITLFGDGSDPQGWRSKLLAADRSGRSDQPDASTGELRVEVLGVWPIRNARNSILALTQGEQQEERRCA